MRFKQLVKKFAPGFLLDFYHYAWAVAGAVVFGFPSLLRQGFGGQGRKLIVIGVTGTSGKSTTVDFITRILEEAGNKVASTSSIRFKVADKEWKNNLKMTMPGRFVIQKVLRQAVNAGCKYAVLEVTSEGIKQFRHKFINFDAAVFLNLTPEHIESHGGFENYRNAKLELFKATPNAHILNVDDKNVQHFLDVPAEKIIGYGIGKSQIPNSLGPQDIPAGASQINPNFKIQNVYAENIQGMSFTVNGVQFNLNLLGVFNIYNALAAIAIAKNYGISLEVCQKALEKVKGLPGRLEVVAKDPFWVVVDYAFTKEQLEASYKSLNERPLVCVLGACGGGRDKWKRPILGKVASQHCKEIIITDEDPYDEDPNQILSEIKSGITKSQFPMSNFYEILDRREAIKKALELAKPGDAVIITGKGSESLMCLAGGKKIPWDDREVVREQLKKIFTP